MHTLHIIVAETFSVTTHTAQALAPRNQEERKSGRDTDTINTNNPANVLSPSRGIIWEKYKPMSSTFLCLFT